MHSKRGEPSLQCWSDKQILSNVSATLQDFYFGQQSEKVLFVDWSIADAKLFFETPTQLGMMIDDTVRLVYLCVFLLREIFS